MKKISSAAKLFGASALVCGILCSCHYDAAVAEPPYGLAALTATVTMPVEGNISQDNYVYDVQDDLSQFGDSEYLNEQEYKALAEEISQWLSVEMGENGFFRMEEYFLSGGGESSVTFEDILSDIEAGISAKDDFSIKMETNRDTDAQLYQLWCAVQAETDRLYAQALRVPEGGEQPDISKFRQLIESFAARTDEIADMTLIPDDDVQTGSGDSEEVPGEDGSGTSGESVGTQSGSGDISSSEQDKETESPGSESTSESSQTENVGSGFDAFEVEMIKYAGENVQIYSLPTDDSPPRGSIPKGASVNVIGETGSWYVMGSGENASGYIKKSAVSDSAPETSGTSSKVTTTKKQTSDSSKVTTTTKKKTTTTSKVTTTTKKKTTTTTKKVTTTTKKKTTTTTTKKVTTTKKTTTTKKVTTAAGPTGDSRKDAQINEVLRLVNEERAKVGAPALKLNTKLCQVAQVRAEEQAVLFGHTRPDGSKVWVLVEALGYEWVVSYFARGENVAQGQQNAAAVMKSWMNSEGHKKNILNSGFNQIGIGYDPDSHSWAQVFIGT